MLPVFFLCLGYQLVIPLLFPILKLSFFAPFLVLARSKLSLPKALLTALLVGLLLDLINSSTPFGFYSLTLTLTMLFTIILNIENFFKDRTATFLMTVLLFVLIQTALQQAFATVFKLYVDVSWEWILSDIIIYPLLDVFYAWLAVYLPLRRYFYNDKLHHRN